MEKDLLKISSNYDIFLLDLYGVIWDGKSIIHKAAEKMAHLRNNGKKVIILSNFDQRAYFVEKRYQPYGLIKGVHYDEIVSSGEVAHSICSQDSLTLKYSSIGAAAFTAFEGSKYVYTNDHKEADFVYTGLVRIRGESNAWQEQRDIDAFKEELEYIYSLGKRLYCLNPDLKAHSENYDYMILCPGSFAAYYEKLGGKVDYVGKPYRLVYDFALRDVTDYSRVLMVGDTLETDILGGMNAGIDTALVRTGVSYEDMLRSPSFGLQAYAYHKGIIPTYTIDHI